ncbi:hypothetical protein [Streptococcus hyovaginalis]
MRSFSLPYVKSVRLTIGQKPSDYAITISTDPLGRSFKNVISPVPVESSWTQNPIYQLLINQKHINAVVELVKKIPQTFGVIQGALKVPVKLLTPEPRNRKARRSGKETFIGHQQGLRLVDKLFFNLSS